MEWGKNTDNSFIRSTQLTLNALGENYSYDFLMGISGAAFKLHFNPDWCPGSADSTTGFDVSNVLFKSLGYECELKKIDDNSFNDIRSLYHMIINQINQGVPIIAINLKVCPVWGIITGYLKNKPGILCRTYFDEGKNYSMAEHAPWLSFFIGNKGKSLDMSELLRNSLTVAVQLARTDEFGEYKSGFSAFGNWIEKLEKKSKAFDEHEVNLTILDYLIDSRQAAVKYLHSMNKLNLMKKGDLMSNNYRAEVELLKNLRKNILPSYDSGKKDWTVDVINKQIESLTQVLKTEKETIGLIEKELQSV